MAKQCGPISVTGTVGGLCFYKMEGKHYVRRKSTLSGKRVKKDPRFKRTMEHAALLAKGSRLASAAYKGLPRTKKDISLFRALTGQAIRLLKEGKEEQQALEVLYSSMFAVV
jgi:hypothetical protein